jgi:hypothetical protein
MNPCGKAPSGIYAAIALLFFGVCLGLGAPFPILGRSHPAPRLPADKGKETLPGAKQRQPRWLSSYPQTKSPDRPGGRAGSPAPAEIKFL